MCNHSNVPLLASVNEPGVDTGGPIVLYDHHNGSTVVVSSLNQFMTAQSTINQQLPFGEFTLRRLTQTFRRLGPGAEHQIWELARPPKARPTALRQVWTRVPKESPHSCLLASADGSSFFAAEVGSIAPAQLQVAGASAAPRVWVWNVPW